MHGIPWKGIVDLVADPPECTMETIHLARWWRRFWAWVIDLILVSIVVNLLTTPLRQILLIHPILDLHWGDIFTTGDLGLQSIVLFFYWTLLEGYSGRSIGKIALNLRVTDQRGEPIGYGAAAIESFGKAFLLPLDCLIGWLAMPGTKLRLFNRISNTIVIQGTEKPPEGIQYVTEKE
jgi:uncharacterized RDD family membrane protein YckC